MHTTQTSLQIGKVQLVDFVPVEFVSQKISKTFHSLFTVDGSLHNMIQ